MFFNTSKEPILFHLYANSTRLTTWAEPKTIRKWSAFKGNRAAYFSPQDDEGFYKNPFPNPLIRFTKPATPETDTVKALAALHSNKPRAEAG